MSTALERARVWLAQRRFDRAEAELRTVLAGEPASGPAHALLGLTLLALDRAPEAVDEARAAIAATPELALAHYALARALASRGMLAEAHRALAEALRLDPQDADAWALEGVICLQEREWERARQMAERALEIDAEHVEAANVRARALVQLGRDADADATLAQTLAHDPENAATHTNVGWSLLERSAPDEAQQSFLEALRLEPDNDAARAGLLESLKARNRFYRAMLALAFWLGRQRRRTVWALLILLWLVPRLLRNLARVYPQLEPVVVPIVIGCAALVLLSWVIGPLFNASLLFHPVGRHALSARERAGAVAVTACLSGALLALVAGFALQSVPSFVAGFALLLFIVPVAAPFDLDNPRRRRHATVVAAVLAALAIAAGLVFQLGGEHGGPVAGMLLGFYGLGVFATSWLVNSWQLSPRTD
jgi:tetratricopeptide (TPR) repeat protein